MCNDAIERWEMKVDKLKDKVSDLQSALAAANEECERLRGECNTLHRELNARKQLCSALQDESVEVYKANAGLQSQLAAKDAMLAAATEFTYEATDGGYVFIERILHPEPIQWFAKLSSGKTDGNAHSPYFETAQGAIDYALAAGWLEPTQTTKGEG